MKTQLIERALASNYFVFVIEEEDANLDTARNLVTPTPFPDFFITMATRNKEPFGRR